MLFVKTNEVYIGLDRIEGICKRTTYVSEQTKKNAFSTIEQIIFLKFHKHRTEMFDHRIDTYKSFTCN